MKNAKIIYEVLNRNVKKIVVETKSVSKEFTCMEDGVQCATRYFTTSRWGDIHLPHLGCGLDPKYYSSFYGIIRGVE